MTRIPRPPKLARAGDVRCACRDRVTGAVWLGAARGALVLRPETLRGANGGSGDGARAWSHVRLQDEAVLACGAGAHGVWLAGKHWLMQPERRGSGVRRYAIGEAMGRAVEVRGVAADRGGIWLSVDGYDVSAPSLLRLPDDPRMPPIFQRFHSRLEKAGPVHAIAGDGERAWALGEGWVLELDERSVVRAGSGEAPAPAGPPKACKEPPPPANLEEEVARYLSDLAHARWLRAHPRGLVGRNRVGMFCIPHGGKATCPELPAALDRVATNWLGVHGEMVIASPVGLYLVGARGLRVIAPGEEIVALLDGEPSLAVTRDAVYVLDAAAIGAAPAAPLDAVALVRQLARRQAGDAGAQRRALVARALGAVGRGEDVAVLLGLLADGTAEVRAASCSALGRLKPPGFEKVLGQMMADSATTVQAAATRALRGS